MNEESTVKRTLRQICIVNKSLMAKMIRKIGMKKKIGMGRCSLCIMGAVPCHNVASDKFCHRKSVKIEDP